MSNYMDYDDDELVTGVFPLNCRRPNAHGGFHHRPNIFTLQPKIRASPLEEWEGRSDIGMSNNVTTSIREFIRGTAIGKTKTRDKSDHATVQKVFDLRTRFIFLKLERNDVIHPANGCISTGKEANVYHTTNADDHELAIKVFKTSVLDFKARYIQGDYRFKDRYCKHNPRKQMKTWAEKEFRNLRRIQEAGIRCPTARHVHQHVLVMDFIGKDGWAAPILKDAALSLDKLRESYREIIISMRMLYQKAKLVHTDLSEFNILYFEVSIAINSESSMHNKGMPLYLSLLLWQGHLYIIDVSQAVNLFDSNANDFLRQDCAHVSVGFSTKVSVHIYLFSSFLHLSMSLSNFQDFFEKHGVAVMTTRELFDFIVDPGIAEDAVDDYLDEVQGKIAYRGVVDELAESVFMQAYIPSSLNDVTNVEADVLRLTSGEDTGDMYYKTITGLRHALSVCPPSEETKSDSGSSDDVTATAWGTEINGNAEALCKKAARKENKKKVKEQNREARKHKIPKAEKKRRKKLSNGAKCR
ncbi:non-specific serine/threonine protein kinase [Ranunculus cassubicifolius]